MPASATLNREAVLSLVLQSLVDLLRSRATPLDSPLGEDVRLLGRGAALDSLGLVALVVEVEQRLEERYGVVVTLADERAMSQRHSPFRTVGTLTDHVCTSIGLRGTDGGP